MSIIVTITLQTSQKKIKTNLTVFTKDIMAFISSFMTLNCHIPLSGVTAEPAHEAEAAVHGTGV